jgi:hypothetical protein
MAAISEPIGASTGLSPKGPEFVRKPQPQTQPGRKHALVVGIQGYAGSKLGVTPLHYT